MAASFVWRGMEIPVHSLNTAVVGSGAAGFNAADWLGALGVAHVALISEGILSGTSRNAGSDKQTYYKLSLCGDTPDSVEDMANTLFAGGSMDGDIALAEAASSTRCFMKLANLGVPFPTNAYGEYAGYKTDHDPRQRATSAGPLTSKYMTEALEAETRRRGIRLFDNHLIIGILTDNGKCYGLLALDLKRLEEAGRGLTLFRCKNVIWATGGAAGLFEQSVYPPSQHGALGIAMEAGAIAANLTEWQHGLASVKFRWNVSGTYQQVLPRYISTDAQGNDEREFLLEYLSPADMLALVFLKGYQWPFDARKLPGSSQIDFYVTRETAMRGRRVYLDFRTNPTGMEQGFNLLSEECRSYLAKCDALFGTPFDRLRKLNPDAIALYRAHGIDIENETLEVAVCAQHMNGGLSVDRWWRTSVEGLYACGEAAGTFGAYRPGGSALNSTQAGSMRAAQHIAARRPGLPDDGHFYTAASAILDGKGAVAVDMAFAETESLTELAYRARSRMSRHGAHLRSAEQLAEALSACQQDIIGFYTTIKLTEPAALPTAFRCYDMLLSQYACLCAMAEYINAGGASRGSALVLDVAGQALTGSDLRFRPYNGAMDSQVLETTLALENGGVPKCRHSFRPVRHVPARELWFENVWTDFREGKLYD